MADTSVKTRDNNDTIILRPTSGWASLNLRDLWIYRELVYFLTWRDVMVTYKQTVLGALWAVINPIVNMVVLEVVFGKFAQMGSEGFPGPIFRFAAVLPWTLFAKSLNSASRSMLSNRAMITKVYFPRLIIPLSSVLSGLVDFAISFVVLIIMMLVYQITPTLGILVLPFIVLLTLVTALGVGLWLSALNVLYRDVGYILPVLTQLLLFISPVGYSTTTVPGKWQLLYALNPMVGVVESFRWAVLGVTPETAYPLWLLVTISSAVAFLLLMSGLFYFQRMERTFADMV